MKTLMLLGQCIGPPTPVNNLVEGLLLVGLSPEYVRSFGLLEKHVLLNHCLKERGLNRARLYPRPLLARDNLCF
jgi:hypothetical protein